MYVRGPEDAPNTVTTKLLHTPMLDEWEVPAGQVIIENRLGEGCFGEVYQGMIKGHITNPKIQTSLKNTICPVVAIKLLKSIQKLIILCLGFFINDSLFLSLSNCQW